MGVFDEIKVVAIDVDGTLTNGIYQVNELNQITKGFHTNDHVALHNLHEDGFRVIIITGANDATTVNRFKRMPFSFYGSVNDKEKRLTRWLKINKLQWKNVLFIGDGDNDYYAMKKAGAAICPANAIPEIKEISNYVTEKEGGDGALYEAARYFYKIIKKEWRF